jgi:cysteine desulfurase
MIYLDNAATTPVNNIVAEVIYDSLKNDFANPSSLYAMGAESELNVNRARKVIADSLNCRANGVYFTASASESNNIAIYGLALARKNWGKKIISTGYEHPAVRRPFENLKELGFETVTIDPKSDGNINEEEILNRVDKNTALVCLIHVNNETGAMIDIENLSKKIKEKSRRTVVHIDATQSYMKYKIDTKRLFVDSMSFSAQKINGPKGIGALYLKSGVNIKPVFSGGGQENGLRSGTENTRYIQGFAKAVEILSPNISKHMEMYKALHDELLEGLNKFDNVIINSPKNRAPYTVNFSFLGYRSETLLHFLDSQGICVSSASACSRGKESHTLSAMGLTKDRIDSALRVSFGVQNTKEDIKALLNALESAREKLQRVDKKLNI